ncbi:MAG: hypothetical protein KBD44_02750 [Candidatus Pacebacteria bacterium]|jgi:hypothetical protein|nr:hypothetical protein [Candidatus Paceibacterota bacterium]
MLSTEGLEDDFWKQLAQAKGFLQDHTHESRGYLPDPAMAGTLPEIPNSQPKEQKRD